jgi:putative Mg2+ transporter-C (MgtC) family protein
VDSWEAVLRLLAAAALGGAIGFERESSDQPAGFRTHILVALGSALFTMVGAYGLTEFSDRGVNFDPTRIAAQIVTGIGFLGAGAILERGIRIRGLTTAAALWVTAAIGMAAGFGYWEGAVGATVIALIALALLKQVENRVFGAFRDKIHLSFQAEEGFDLARVESLLKDHDMRMSKVEMEHSEGGNRVAMTLLAKEKAPSRALVEKLSDLPDVSNVDWKD